MRYLKRAVCYSLGFLFLNVILFYTLAEGFSTPLKILATALLAAYFIYYSVRPAADRRSTRKQRNLIGGYELLLASGFFLASQIALYICVILGDTSGVADSLLIANAVFSVVFIHLFALNGWLRIALSSKQLGAALRVALIFLWWVPLANLVVLGMAAKTAKREYSFLRKKRQLNEGRQGQGVCATKHPVMMVHGVFFRDWKHFNYWGRIPQELSGNGARIFYGEHNSALPVEQAAQELKQRMLDIMAETGCEKINIIAHSKGGLDARWAISCLGMDAHVASLTTVNTPHRGTPLAGTLLKIAPNKLVSAVDKQYGRLFKKLGDDDCDFLGSVNGLTPERCEELNAAMPDRAGVLYQSVGSKMSAVSSAGPPLNAGYAFIKPLGGENDGLVCVDSMPWGHCLGILSTPGKKGVSHGDMIDLTRKNIPNFDVCEFYVKLLSDLREKGL